MQFVICIHKNTSFLLSMIKLVNSHGTRHKCTAYLLIQHSVLGGILVFESQNGSKVDQMKTQNKNSVVINGFFVRKLLFPRIKIYVLFKIKKQSVF